MRIDGLMVCPAAAYRLLRDRARSLTERLRILEQLIDTMLDDTSDLP